MSNIVFPDYNNSILNLVSSLCKAFDVDIHFKPLSYIDTEKLSERKNVVLIILDGMGYNLFNYIASAIDIKGYKVNKITSVFPPTTASAITSIMTGEAPVEHGVIGWTLYFKEFGKLIDVLPKIESPTGELLNESYNLNEILQIKNIFKIISIHSPKVDLTKITPEYIANSDFSVGTSTPAKIFPYEEVSEMFTIIEKTVKNVDKKRKFIVAYSVNPDGLEHINGVYSDKVLDFMKSTFYEIRKLANLLKGENTTVFVTADHGLTDVDRYFYVNDDRDLSDTLILPIFPEPRFATFFVKQGRDEDFKRAIMKYKSDFILMTRNEFFKRGLLGEGKFHRKIDDFIGDYILIAKSSSVLKMRYRQNKRKGIEFKAHHAGLTSEEMYVPLIEID